MSGQGIDEADLLAINLMRDLAWLDNEQTSGKERQQTVEKALKATIRLLELGGGSIGEDKLEAVQAALRQELARSTDDPTGQ